MIKSTLPVAFALAVTFAAAPVLAQGKGQGQNKGQGQDRPRQEVRRDQEPRRSGSSAQRRVVPPGWCLGRGNPHNTSANCGYRTDRIYRDRNGVWRDRYGDRITRDGIYRDIEGILRDRYGRRLR